MRYGEKHIACLFPTAQAPETMGSGSGKFQIFQMKNVLQY